MSTRDALPELALERGASIVADLHLDAASAEHASAFVEFVARTVRGPQLFVLGDLFEAWVGPAHARLDGARRVFDALRDYTRGGGALEFVPGNRDFLLGRDFELAVGARVHPRGFVAANELGRTLFVHGDELCTLDRDYQRMKRVLRSAPIAWLAPRMPTFLSLAIARRLRKASVRAIEAKPAAEKEQQAGEVARLAALHRASTVVVGHAHRYRDESVGGVRWIVLDAFGAGRDVACAASDGRIEVLASRGEPRA